MKLDISGAPPGVKVTPAAPEIKASEKSVDVTIEAAKDATLGEHTVTVKGIPSTGEPATGSFKVDVKKS